MINILGIEYKLYFNAEPEQNCSSKHNIGMADHEEKHIIISDLNLFTLKEVLMHEIIHCFMFESGIDRIEFSEEDIVNYFARMIPKINKAFEEALEIYSKEME